ncbi:MAG: NTF2-like N-terminal transpeptidase domain-containing protein, partial [Chloroflexota bacterium]
MSRNRPPYAARRQPPRNVLAVIILTLFGIGVVAIGLFLLADQLGTSPLTADDGSQSEEVAGSGDNGDSAGEDESAGESPTPPNPEDMESARDIAEGWSQLWEAEDYSGMYELISEQSKSVIEREEFVERYEGITTELGQTSIEVEITDEIEDALRYTLTVQRESSRVGEFEDEITLPMIEEAEGRPRVEWTPSVIVSELGDGFIRWKPDIPQRGRILDRHGRPLAHLGEINKVGVIPGDIEDEDALLEQLSEHLEMTEDQIQSRYADGDDSWFMPVKDYPSQMDEELREQVTSIPGVSIQEWPERVYPAGEDAAHVVGYLTEVTLE